MPKGYYERSYVRCETCERTVVANMLSRHVCFVRNCLGCGNKLSVDSYRARRYCNRQCWLNRYNREERTHGLNGARKAGQVQVSRRGSGTKTYVKENKRHQHRVVAERELGRPLASGEVVHHEDRDKKNNDPTNLFVFPSQAEHARHHGHGRGGDCQCSYIPFKRSE